MSKESADDFMIAEYSRLAEFSSTTIGMRESRLNFFLAILSGAIVGLTLLQSLGDSTLLLIIDCAIIGGIFWIGLITFRNTVRHNFDIVRYQEDMEKIREYFVKDNRRIEKYLRAIIVDERRYEKKFPLMTSILNSMIAGSGLVLLVTKVIGLQSSTTYYIALSVGFVVFFATYRIQKYFFVKEVKKILSKKARK